LIDFIFNNIISIIFEDIMDFKNLEKQLSHIIIFN